MTVFFIGAGPGAPDLLTIRADRLIRRCPVCLYAGSIVPPEVLEHTPAGAQLVNTARMPLDEIITIMVTATREGNDVARLHSGDPAVYSAVGEQARRLSEQNIDYEIVPGVPSFSAAAAALGRELTVPTVGQTVILTRINGRASQMPVGEDLASLASHTTTLCIHLAAHAIGDVVEQLSEHYAPTTPVAVVAYASRTNERIVRGQLSTIAEKVIAGGIRRTALIVVGDVLTASDFPDSFLYSDERPRDDEGRTIPCVR